MLPPGLSMLWEQVEPKEALRERFGFDEFAAVSDWVSKVLDEVWAISVVACGRMVISDHNAIVWVESSHGPFVVKWSRSQERFANLEASARLLRVLDRQGVPVAAPIAALDGRDRVMLDGPLGPLSIAVLPELSGDWLDPEDVASVWAAGACLAELHEALRSNPVDQMLTTAGVAGLTERIVEWIAHQDRGLAPVASHRLKELVANLPELDDEPQLVHNDFRAANILTRGSNIIGVLDFDEMQWDHRVSDLAKASIYLGTRFTDWRPTPAAVRQTLRAGYESVRPLGPVEAGWLDALILWQAIQAIPGTDDPAGWAQAL
ncbi:phosphotransferase [Agromyces albus]|uniref:phosphotransferase n=1 Tax=Agromyces albus TaxID=205332 RepID=UPI0027D77F8B|nr:phosphotransferase [Agromyces albus]